MAYNETLASRIRAALSRKKNVQEKKMFGSVCFLLNGNLCVGVWKDSLIVRIGPDQYETALRERHVMPFDITGRAMRGWVMVSPAGIEADQQLKDWIARSTRFVSDLVPK